MMRFFLSLFDSSHFTVGRPCGKQGPISEVRDSMKWEHIFLMATVFFYSGTSSVVDIFCADINVSTIYYK